MKDQKEVTVRRNDTVLSKTFGVSAVNTNDKENARTLFNLSHAVTTGIASHSITKGYRSHAVACGSSAMALARGKSIAAALGTHGGVMVEEENAWVVLVEHDKEGDVKEVHTAKVGGKIKGVEIKANTWYKFHANLLWQFKPSEDDETIFEHSLKRWEPAE